MSDNILFLIGNLCRDPELSYTTNGKPLCKFSIACNRKYKVGDEWKQEPSFFDITVWGKLGEKAGTKLKKGQSILVEGRLQQDRWQGKDNKTRSKVHVVANNVIRVKSLWYDDKNTQSGQYQQSKTSRVQEPAYTEDKFEDDIPF